MKKLLFYITFLLFANAAFASYMLIPMDEKQTEHLKAYGITYWVLSKNVNAYWLLNYRGGSFAFPHSTIFEKECKVRGVLYEVIADGEFVRIREEIANPEVNEEVIKLEIAPKIAVYTPDTNEKGEKIQAWDDAVTLVLTYAEIPYDVLYDTEVLNDKLAEYDWLHLHHEDFTGQYGRFYASFGSQPWYKAQVHKMEELAKFNGYTKVSQLKLAVAKKLKEYIGGGGFMFAMCSATDSYDIALAADGLDICAEMYDGDAADPNAQSKLNFENTLAFRNFNLKKNPLEYEFSDIDNTQTRQINPENDYFTLFDFSAKYDPVPTMLTQCQTKTVKGFMGQTTGFRKEVIKPSVLILGESKPLNEARYIHGIYGKGFWTWYAGHDPEDYRHQVGDPDTDLSLHPLSPGYRLILNNVLFPAAEKKKRKT
ncbi:MAG: asparagine synthetase B [Saprospiraceae bacterium]|nr:asparagine synthetase B [Saprospiraceae bacterium]